MLHDRGIWALSTKRHGCARVNRGHGGCTTQRWIVHLYGNRRPRLHNPPPPIPQFASVAPSPHARVFHCRMCSLGLFITDVFTRLTRNLRIYDPPSLMHAILTIKLSRTSSLFSFSFESVGFDRRVFILFFFFKRGTIVTLDSEGEEICLRAFVPGSIYRGDTRKSVFWCEKSTYFWDAIYLESSIAA